MNSVFSKCLATSVLALATAGCGPAGPRLYKAGGIVTRNKAPLAEAQVVFAYEDGNFASGYTDSAGKFVLTYMNHPGVAAPGKCKVTVTKRAGATSSGPPPAILDATPKSAEDYKAKMDAQKRTMEGFNKKQNEQDAAGNKATFEKSGLAYEITTDESKNNFQIDLPD